MNTGCQKCDKFKQTGSPNYQGNLDTKEESELWSPKKKNTNNIHENMTKEAIVEMTIASSQNIWLAHFPEALRV